MSRLNRRSYQLKVLHLLMQGSETRGFFTLENRLLRVVRADISITNPWLVNRQICELNNPNRRVLTHVRAGQVPTAFYQWELDAKVLNGDVVAFIEVTDNHPTRSLQPSIRQTKFWHKLSNAGITRKKLATSLTQWWQERSQTQRVAVFSAFLMVGLFIFGTFLYKYQYGGKIT